MSANSCWFSTGGPHRLLRQPFSPAARCSNDACHCWFSPGGPHRLLRQPLSLLQGCPRGSGPRRPAERRAVHLLRSCPRRSTRGLGVEAHAEALANEVQDDPQSEPGLRRHTPPSAGPQAPGPAASLTLLRTRASQQRCANIGEPAVGAEVGTSTGAEVGPAVGEAIGAAACPEPSAPRSFRCARVRSIGHRDTSRPRRAARRRSARTRRG